MLIRSARIKGPSNLAENKLTIDVNIVKKISSSDYFVVALINSLF
jgi:hypothetical protein